MLKSIFVGLLSALFGFVFFLFMYKNNQIDLKQAETSLASYITSANSTQKLVLFEVNAVEKIKRTESLNPLWSLISSAQLNVEMLVPVQYSFYIDLQDKLSLEYQNSVLVVTAPSLMSSQPAPDISGISFSVKEAPFFYDVRKVEDQIRAKLTPYLIERSESLKLTYEVEAAESLKKLVKRWMSTDENFMNKPEIAIQVKFAPAKSGPSISPHAHQ